jgi:hypothetical protein
MMTAITGLGRLLRERGGRVDPIRATHYLASDRLDPTVLDVHPLLAAIRA